MVKHHPATLAIAACVVALCVASSFAVRRVKAEENQSFVTFSDSAGEFSTVNVNGDFDLQNPFFRELGTNGRACVTCHQPDEGWTVTPEGLRRRFDRTAKAPTSHPCRSVAGPSACCSSAG